MRQVIKNTPTAITSSPIEPMGNNPTEASAHNRVERIAYARRLLSEFKVKGTKNMPWLEGRLHLNARVILESPSADDILSEIPVDSKQLSYGFSSVTLLTPSGHVLRIERSGGKLLNIKGLLQPINEKFIGGYYLETLPLVTVVGFTVQDVISLEKQLNEQGYTFNDYTLGQWDNYNLGRLPNGEVVVIDPGAVSKLTGKSRTLEELDAAVRSSADNATNHNPDASTPNAQLPSDSKKGGIDFRALPIVNQPINTAMLKLSAADLSRLNNVNLNSEWGEIQNMVNVGIIPSNERIKEYVLASCLRQSLGREMDKVLGCIADIMRMEEDRVSVTEPELRDMLVLLESGRPTDGLSNDLSRINFSPKEPELIPQ